ILVERIIIVSVGAGIALLPALAAVVADIGAVVVAGAWAVEVAADGIVVAITVAVIGVVIALTVARGFVAAAVAAAIAVLEALTILVRRAALVSIRPIILAAILRSRHRRHHHLRGHHCHRGKSNRCCLPHWMFPSL